MDHLPKSFDNVNAKVIDDLRTQLTEQIAADDKRVKLLAKIATLERKMASEKQPRRKWEYFELIKKLKATI